MSTTYMGIRLRNPIVASPSPLCERLENLQRMEEAGVGAVVLHSLFEEQLSIESDHLDRQLSHGEGQYAEATSYFPDLAEYKFGPSLYLKLLKDAKKSLSIPVIASLNGSTHGGWLRFARDLEDAGADALELNMYMMATDPNEPGFSVEQRQVDIVNEVCRSVRIPVAVKVGPSFSAPVNMASRFAEAGAAALVVFNRFYQPDFDLEKLEVVPNLQLSTPDELRLRLRWVSLMYGHVPLEFAVTGGVHSTEDVVKSIMAGGRVAMMTSALLKHGVGHASKVIEGLFLWMEDHGYANIQQMRGAMSAMAMGQPVALERANYLKVLCSYAVAKSA